MNKHIEELACIMGRGCDGCKTCISKNKCELIEYAELVFKAGYVKQKECKNISDCHPVDEFICSNCNLIIRDCGRYEIDEDANGDESYLEFAFKYCPRCGAKVIEE